MTNEITAGAVMYVADLGALAAFYAAALGFSERMRDADHVVLEANAFQLVLLKRDAPTVAAADAGGAPRRSDSAIKPVFIVTSIGDARAAATTVGGLINAARHEWQFGDYRVCDGLDPEGNVIQLRERRIEPKAGTGG
jgi:predicted enzyme related to lactoylglutathione lyase